MEIIGTYLQTVCFLVSMAFVTPQDSYDYYYGGDTPSGDYKNIGWDFTVQHDNAPNLKNHTDVVAKLYGSESAAKDEFWDRVNKDIVQYERDCGFGQISVIEGLKALAVYDPSLENEDKEILVSAADKDIAEIVKQLDKHQLEKNCSELYENLRNSRSHLECAIGKKEVTMTLSEIFSNASPQCWYYSQEFWKKLVQKGDFDSKCNATLVYSDVIRIGKIANKILPSFGSLSSSTFNDHQEQLGGALVATVSSPKHVNYLASFICPSAANPWNCTEIMDKVYGVLCNDVSIQPVIELEKLVKSSRSKPFDSFEEAEIAMEILEDVTEIVHVMSVADNIMPRFAQMSVSSLDIYMDIMDDTIGKSAEKMWSQLSEEERKHQLTRILGNNDKYVWSMSRIFFSSQGHRDAPRELTKESMALKLWKFDPSEQSAKNIAFDFDDAAIQTNFGGDATKSGLNVYAIHYETLAQLIQKNGISINATSQNNTKEFVGKGGIISLSAHHDIENMSLPVTYRMNFQKSDSSQPDKRRVCLSCEFLDLETGNWSKTGCSVSSVDDGGVTCDCNHTTNFAAFMSPTEVQYTMTQAQYQAEQIVSYVGSALSVLSLTLCLIIFNIVKPSLRNERVKAHISLTFALLMVHMTQVIAHIITA